MHYLYGIWCSMFRKTLFWPLVVVGCSQNVFEVRNTKQMFVNYLNVWLCDTVPPYTFFLFSHLVPLVFLHVILKQQLHCCFRLVISEELRMSCTTHVVSPSDSEGFSTSVECDTWNKALSAGFSWTYCNRLFLILSGNDWRGRPRRRRWG